MGTVTFSAQWPQFRGETGLGTSTSTSVPLSWSEEENIRWKTAVPGRGWSSPVIADSQVWLTTATEDGRALSAMAIDEASGKVRHDIKVFDVDAPQEIHPVNSYASPTPVLETGRVYVTYGMPEPPPSTPGPAPSSGSGATCAAITSADPAPRRSSSKAC